MAGYAHEVLVAQLIVLFFGWVVPRGGFVGGSESKIATGPRRGRKPDLTVYFPGRKPKACGLIHTPPDIVVEVVSSGPRDSQRDRIDKLDEYASFGIQYYWIVDPAIRTVEIFELDKEGRYSRRLGASHGIIESVPGCNGLPMSIDELWSSLDRLDAEQQ